jgi:hypothetical protein
VSKKFYTKEEALLLIDHNLKMNKAAKDMTGFKYEQLTVLGRSHKDNQNHYFLWVECSYGNCFQMRASSWKYTQSCGCMTGYYQKLNTKPREKIYDNTKYKDKQYGILKMTGDYSTTYKYSDSGLYLYECYCTVCNSRYNLGVSVIKTGFSQKCNCWKEHAVDWIKSQPIDSNHHLYKTFTAMHSRCYNVSSPTYERYGAVGVMVCDEWEKSARGFAKFLEDMLPSWQPDLSLHRLDNFPLYSKETCIWATNSIQAHVQKKREYKNGKPSSVFIGVSRHKSKTSYKAQIMIDRVATLLGFFKTELAAALEFDRAAYEFYGEHANVNGEAQWEAYKQKVGAERAIQEMRDLCLLVDKEDRQKYVYKETT